MTQKKPYSATIGVYVRVYCQFNFEAENDEAATQAAIDKFKSDDGDDHFYDTDWDNLIHPSLLTINSADSSNHILVDTPFPLSAHDAREMASEELLTALEEAIAEFEKQPAAPMMHLFFKKWRAAVAKAKAV